MSRPNPKDIIPVDKTLLKTGPEMLPVLIYIKCIELLKLIPTENKTSVNKFSINYLLILYLK